MSGGKGHWTSDPWHSLRARPGVELAAASTRATHGFDGGPDAGMAALARGAVRFAELQEVFYANSRMGGGQRSILLVLQAMDTAGKGGIVGHVVRAADPSGVRVTAFKKPTAEEASHDFLWRIRPHMPEPGLIGVFDRSHYEDVLIARVRNLAPAAEIERRYEAIVDFEAELAARETTVIKVMLHLSMQEQARRLETRLDDPRKHWKFSPADIDDRELWSDYQAAYQLVFDRTSTDNAPWFVVPADKKWYARLAVQQLLLHVLEDMKLEWPKADYDVEAQRERLQHSNPA